MSKADAVRSAQLPFFPYHPDPVATGAVVASDGLCVRCRQHRGFIYAGPVYAEEELVDALCPWCIADGSAAERFDAEFTDPASGVPGDVPAAVTEQLVRRTPGFAGWQQERWLYHCADAAEFRGPAGAELLAGFPDALDSLRGEHAGRGWSADDIEAYLRSLTVDGQPTAYLFRCRHCGTHLAYSDFT